MILWRDREREEEGRRRIQAGRVPLLRARRDRRDRLGAAGRRAGGPRRRRGEPQARRSSQALERARRDARRTSCAGPGARSSAPWASSPESRFMRRSRSPHHPQGFQPTYSTMCEEREQWGDAEARRLQRRKRDPAKTPEPFGGEATSGGAPIFVVQKHAARSLHYDFRLERDGALASWAVPKGIPLEPGAKALAVHVEDHPLDYATFAGEIPTGSVRRRDGRDLGPRHLRAARGEARRRADRPARRRAAPGRLDARAGPSRRQGAELADPAEARRGRRRDAADGRRATSRCSRRSSDELPRAGEWLYEVKFDGYRALAYVRGGALRAALPQRTTT